LRRSIQLAGADKRAQQSGRPTGCAGQTDARGNLLLQANGAKCAASEPSITGGFGLVIGRHGDNSAAFKATRWPERGCGRAIQSARAIDPHTSNVDRWGAAVTSVTSCNQ